MDYRYLKAFLLTAEYLSFSKAAEKLSIAQSAVSRQIKLLEESLGLELIIRSSKKIILTHKGQELYMAAKSFDKVTTDIFEQEDTRPLKIGVLHGLLETWLSPILSKYYKKYDRNCYIQVEEPKALREGMHEGKFDVIFSIDNVQSDLISSLKLFDEKLVLISKESIQKKKLNNYRWIIYNEVDNIFRISKKPSDKIVSVNSITTLVNLVKSGVGVAVVPDHMVKKNDNLNVLELSELPKSEIYMTTLNYQTLPTQIKELADLIKN